MNNTNWLDVIPSTMSAIATIGASIAAFLSLRVSREAKKIAEQSALAVHHGSAATKLADAIDTLKMETLEFSKFARDIWERWPCEIEVLDHRDAGGENPRPLRHVLSNASEMLVMHGTEDGAEYKRAQSLMFSIIRDGIYTNDTEYESLLEIADGKYGDFESIFGNPPLTKPINSAPAFRWACYQLVKRVDKNAWLDTWKKAWQKDGWLFKYRDEHERIKKALESTLKSLNNEKAKLAHTVFPLDANPSLSLKYEKVLTVIKVLLEDCGLDLYSGYIEEPHEDEVIRLVVYSMGIAFLADKALESITY